jgi:3-phenylpropionate/trans-cinnamate dioxygenase ferredoxin reductase subunit
MLGRGVPYDRLPYFYSDQYDVSMEYRGFTTAWDRVVVRGDLAARSFLMFYVRDDRVAAAMNVNVTGAAKALDALIRSGAPADDARLADLDVPFEALVAG